MNSPLGIRHLRIDMQIQLHDAMHSKVLLTSYLETAILIYKEVPAQAVSTPAAEKTSFHQANKPLQQTL